MMILPFLSFAQIDEGFEGATFPPTTPANWVVLDNGVGPFQSWIETTDPTRVHTGAKAAIIDRENIGATNTSEDWLVSPQVLVPTNGQLRFFTRRTLVGNRGTEYEIRVSNNPIQNNQGAYLVAQSWNDLTLNTTYNIYEEKVVSLAGYAGQQVYIAFVRKFYQPTTQIGGDRWLLDDIKVVEQCLNPTGLNVPAATLASVTATLNWTSPGAATQWEIEVLPFASTPTGVGVVTGATTYNATGLTPGTDYIFYVRSLCGGGINSNWVSQPFTTKPLGSICASPITIGSLPFSHNSNTNLYGDEVDNPQGAGCAGGATNYLQGYEVFYSYTATANANINVTMTPGGPNSAIFIYNGCGNVGVSCLGGVANTGAGPRVITPFAVVAGQTYVFVISTNTTTQTVPYSLVIQEVTCTPPVPQATTSIGMTTANLSWSNPTGATAWEVVVQPAGSVIPSGAGTPAGTNVNFPVSGLTPNTNYQYWVRSECSPGVYSPWALSAQFKTRLCEVADQCNYTFRLTSTSGGWGGARMEVRQNGVVVHTLGTTFTSGTLLNETVALCQNFPFELFWTLGGTTPTRVGISVINNFAQTLYTKPAGTGASNTLLYTTSINCSVAACLDPTNLTTNTPTTTTINLAWTPNGSTLWDIYLVPTGSPAPTAGSTPTYPGVTTNPFTATGLTQLTTYDFYVRAICSPTSNSNWSTPRTFTTLPTCPAPTGLVASAPTSSTVNLAWTNVGSATTWNVIALPCGSPAPTASSTGWIVAPTNPFVYTGLTAGTCYTFYVRGFCSPTDTGPWSASAQAITLPGCGGGFYDSGGPLGNYSNNEPGNPITISPINPGDVVTVTFTSFVVDDGNWDGLYVFDGNSTAAPQISSGNPAGSGPLTLPGAFWGTTNPGPFTSTAPDGSLTFQFKSDGSGVDPGWVANVTCGPRPTCTRPTLLTASGATQTSATLGWTQPLNPDSSQATAWQVILLPCGSPAPTASSTGWVNAPVNPFVATGLNSGTCYDFYVRAVCSPTDSSIWSSKGSFTTLIANDECANAVVVGVNSDASCAVFGSGTVTGATGSLPTTTCTGANDDVWFQFTAISDKHYINLFNVTGSTTDLNHAVYSGTCGALTQVGACQNNNESIVAGLAIGTTYYIRIFTGTTTANQTTAFNICIGTVASCATAEATCSDPNNPFIFPNTTGVPSEGRVTCLATVPNPTYYYLTILQSGNLQFQISQNTSFNAAGNPTGTALDVDFVAWGPYVSNTAACGNLGTGCPNPTDCFNNFPGPSQYPYGNIVDCSYHFQAVETCTINNAVAGQVYVILITNFNGDPGFIRFDQSNFGVPGSGLTDCSIVCEVDLGPDQNLCGVTSVPLDSQLANPLATFKWYKDGVLIPGANSQTYTATQSGTYSVTGTCGPNSVGYPNDPDGTVVINMGPNVIISDQADYIVCDDASNDGVATFDLSTRTPIVLTGLDTNYTYTVSYYNNEFDALAGNANTINPAIPYVGPSQTIYIRVVANGSPICNTVVAQNLVVGPLPAATFNYPATPYCQNVGTVAPTFTGGGVAGTFSVVPPTTTGLVIDAATGIVDLTNSTPGNYVVENRILGSGGCLDVIETAPITITALPIATFNYPDTPYCQSEVTAIPTFTGGGVAGTFSFTPAGLAINTTTGVIDLTNSTPGTYTVTNTILAAGGCNDVPETATITIYANPEATLTSSDPDYTICSNEAATLTVTPTNGFAVGDATYVWTLNGNEIVGQTSYTIPVTATGTYGVVITLNGCTNVAPLTQTFTVNFVPDFTLSGTNLVKCANEIAVLTVSPINYTTEPVTYSWTLNNVPIPGTSSSVSIPVTSFGTYAVTVTNQGCTSDPEIINVDLDLTNIPISTTGECVGISYIITSAPVSGSYDAGTVTYEWLDENGDVIAGANQATFNVSQYVIANNISASSFPLTFTVKITTTPEGCIDTQSFDVASSVCTIQRGISPNGDGDNETFDLRGLGVKELSIFNRYGTKVYGLSNYTNEWKGQTDKGQELPDGTYYYVIEQNNGENKSGWVYINR